MERTVWDIINAGEEIDYNTPNRDDFDVKIKECVEKFIRYNSTSLTSDERGDLLSSIVGYPVDKNTRIVPPFYCDLGFNIKLGKNILINYNCVLLDTGEIRIGDNVLIGPGTKIVTAKHPLDHERRRVLATTGHTVVIEDDVWIGAGAVVLPGVTIGARSVVGAGAVVTKDVPPDTVVVGNPAKVLKKL